MSYYMTASKKAILVVSYGTSYEETREKTIGAIERHIADTHPGWEVRRAFTSKSVLRILEKKGVHIDFVSDALDRMIYDGIDTVIVQPTHVMNGLEYDIMMKVVRDYSVYFRYIEVGTPLLTSADDYDEVIAAIERSFITKSNEVCGKNHAIVLMGHGTDHFANSTYSELQLRLMTSGHTNVFVTTVEGFPSFDDTISMMRAGGYDEVALFPMMLVAGDHVINDMAGDDEDSLKCVLENEGYKVTCIVKGLGEYPDFQELFRFHVDVAMSRLPSGSASDVVSGAVPERSVAGSSILR